MKDTPTRYKAARKAEDQPEPESRKNPRNLPTLLQKHIRAFQKKYGTDPSEDDIQTFVWDTWGRWLERELKRNPDIHSSDANLQYLAGIGHEIERHFAGNLFPLPPRGKGAAVQGSHGGMVMRVIEGDKP